MSITKILLDMRTVGELRLVQSLELNISKPTMIDLLSLWYCDLITL